jgi:hypothetical protein
MSYAIHKIKGLPVVEENRRVTLENIKYGQMVEVLNYDDPHGSYHAGCKVHFFNKKGVLIGNYYEFVPYERLRHIANPAHSYPRYFMGRNYLKKQTPIGESIKTWLFIGLCNIITRLIKFTQTKID